MFKSLLLKNFETQNPVCRIRIFDDGRISINDFIFTMDEVHRMLNEFNNWENCLVFNQNLRNVLIKNNVIKSIFVYSTLKQENDKPQHTEVYCKKSENFKQFFTLFLDVQKNPNKKIKFEPSIKLDSVLA